MTRRRFLRAIARFAAMFVAMEGVHGPIFGMIAAVTVHDDEAALESA